MRASSSASAPRGRVPAIGRVEARRPETVSSGSGLAPGDLEVAEVQEVHVRAGVHGAQAAVDRERLDRHLAPTSAGWARPGRRRPRGRTRRCARPSPRTARAPCCERNSGIARPGERGGAGTGPGQTLAHLGDRLPRRGVGALHVVLGVDVGQDRDRVLEVVEDHQHVGEHERHVRQAERRRGSARPAARPCARGRSRRTRPRRRRTAAGRAAAPGAGGRPRRRPGRRDPRDRPATT